MNIYTCIVLFVSRSLLPVLLLIFCVVALLPLMFVVVAMMPCQIMYSEFLLITKIQFKYNKN
jgi:hypothetical protein